MNKALPDSKLDSFDSLSLEEIKDIAFRNKYFLVSRSVYAELKRLIIKVVFSTDYPCNGYGVSTDGGEPKSKCASQENNDDALYSKSLRAFEVSVEENNFKRVSKSGYEDIYLLPNNILEILLGRIRNYSEFVANAQRNLIRKHFNEKSKNFIYSSDHTFNAYLNYLGNVENELAVLSNSINYFGVNCPSLWRIPHDFFIQLRALSAHTHNNYGSFTVTIDASVHVPISVKSMCEKEAYYSVDNSLVLDLPDEITKTNAKPFGFGMFFNRIFLRTVILTAVIALWLWVAMND